MRWKKLLTIGLVIAFIASGNYAQSLNNPIELKERNLGGPRLGLTFVHGGELVETLKENNMDRLISQFGWSKFIVLYSLFNFRII